MNSFESRKIPIKYQSDDIALHFNLEHSMTSIRGCEIFHSVFFISD